MTTTLAYTTSTTDENRLRIARVAAGSRVQRQRIIAEYRATVENARREAVVATYLSDLRKSGAVRVGFKICTDDYGKIRMIESLDDARWTLLHYYGQDMEAWGIKPDGEYMGIW